MKMIIKLTIIFIVLFSFGCDDMLDKEPLTQISDALVWENEELMELYVIDLYSRIPIKEVFNDHWKYTDIATTPSGNKNVITLGTMNEYNEALGLWDYKYIRDCNIFIEKATEAPIAEDLKSKLIAEVRFMRAIYYFEAAKRYGGVPLITTVLDAYAPAEDNYIPRSKEDEIYEFILTELDEIKDLLNSNEYSKSRFNKWMALSYMSKVSLWAASISNYGTLDLDGIVGVPANKKEYYYSKAFETAKKVINEGPFTLFDKYQDKSKNYSQIFMEEGNSEVIFQKEFNGIEVAHNWDNLYMPPGYSSTYGGRCNPFLEFVLSYENKDGSDDQPQFGTEYLYSDANELFSKKDPRLNGTIMYQGTEWGGDIVQTYAAIDINENPDPNNLLFTLGETYEGVPQVGKDSRRGTSNADNNGVTGFYCKKYLDESNLFPIPNTSKTNWIIIRLADLYLTAAESAYELGEIDQAVQFLNPIRERAGISLLTQETITRSVIRNERKIELAFEGQRYWDLRRWRVSETYQVNNGNKFHGLDPIYHLASDKFYFLPIEAEDFIRVFRQEHYYNPITRNRINNNPALIENPLY